MLLPEASDVAAPAYWQAAFPKLKKIALARLHSAQQGANEPATPARPTARRWPSLATGGCDAGGAAAPA